MTYTFLLKQVFLGKRNFLFIPIFFVLSPLLHAQKDNIRFENISTDQGLSQSSVITICQDKKGFLWFGTYEGLNRFDGYQFKLFQNNPNDTTSLSKNFIWNICEDHFGNIWVATDEGLNKYDRDKETFARFKENPGKKFSISSNRIKYIYEDKKNMLWVGTEDGLNIYNYKDNSFKVFKNEPKNNSSISNNFIHIIYEDSQENLWIGTDNGLNLFDRRNGKFKRYFHDDSDPNSINSNSIISICEDQNGFLWIGTLSSGLNKLDKNSGKFKHYEYNPDDPNGLSYNYVRALFRDKAGNLWIGTFGGGLEKYDPIHDRFIHFQNDPDDHESISSNAIYSIIEDNSGIIWIGTAYGGVNKYDKWKNQFELYTIRSKNKNLFSNEVNCFYEDPADNGKKIWIGTRNGLVLFDREKNIPQFYVNNPDDKYSISHNVIKSICKDTKGMLWIGTDNGLNRFDKKKNKFYHYFNDPHNSYSISNNFVKSILVDDRGEIWIGTNSSIIDKYDPVRDGFKHYNNETYAVQTNYNIVWVLYEDQKGNILAGSDAGGVSILDRNSGKFIQYINSKSKDKDKISSDKVLTLFENSKGLWIGTGGGGLNCFDPSKGKVKVISEKEGLASNSIHGIIEDKEGNFWISTRKGISKINFNENKISNYGEQDGLQSNEFLVNSYCYSKTGEAFFGGIKGFNSFWPEKIIPNKFLPRMVFTDIQLFNKSVPINKPIDGRILLNKSITESNKIILSYKDEIFTVEFSCLDYSAPESNVYSYILEGYDKEWNEIGNRHFASYTKIPAGKYKLIVKGSSRNGSWNNVRIALDIIITPPYWETWWFRTLIILLVLGSLLFGYRMKTKRIVAYNKELEQRVKERTSELEYANKELEAFSYSVSHDLRAPLRAINGYGKIVIEEYENKIDEEGKRLLNVIISNSVKMEGLINELLRFSKTSIVELKRQYVDMEKLVLVVIDELIENSNRKKEEIRVHPLPGLICDQALLKQVWQNLISNALKFTSKVQNPEIEIGFLDDDKKQIYFIKDNGAGFNQKYANKLFGVFERLHNDSEFEGIGAGLAIVKRIIQRHNGHIWANGEVNKGATFYFFIPQREVQKKE